MQELVGTLFLALLCSSMATQSAPKVQVYTGYPEQFGKENTFICHVTCFYPPLISIKLLKDDLEIPRANLTDLAFGESWNFHLTRYAPFTPNKGEKYVCRVEHMGTSKDYTLELGL